MTTPQREIAFDTETTGFNPDDGDRLVEIGAVELINGIETGRVFHTYINPLRDVPIAAQNVHGLTTERLKSEPLFEDIAQDFLSFIEDSPLIAHNASFDMKFINSELKKAGYTEIDPDRFIDTLPMARQQFPGSPANLDALCRRFNISLSGREKHGALIDASLLGKVYLELTGGRQKKLDLILNPNQSNNTTSEDIIGTIKTRVPLYATLTEEEKENHKILLTKLKNPLWSSLETSSKDSE